jgi:hypothetical protein
MSEIYKAFEDKLNYLDESNKKYYDYLKGF